MEKLTPFKTLLFTYMLFCLSHQIVNSVSIKNDKLEPLKPSENYGKNAIIVDQDENNNIIYMFFWKLLANNDEIQFEVHAKNLGWVGLGISMSGGMRGADIAMGWVDSNGKPHIRVLFLFLFKHFI